MDFADSEINDCLKWAFNYLAKGCSVIPVGLDKKPLISWKEFQSRRPTVDELKNWWKQFPAANVAIITGQISNLIVVDVEKDGVISDLPQTSLIRTGGGGWHFYYKYIPGYENKARIRPLTDIRGEGGYVVAPPSMHLSGNRYTILEDRPLAEFPVFIFDPKPKISDWQEIVSGVQLGTRNEMATRITGKLLRSFHPSEWENTAWVILRKWNETNKPPLFEHELRTIYKSVSRRAINDPRPEEKITKVEFVPFTKVLKDSIEELQNTRPEDIISFGYDWLDERLTGFFKGELVVIGGETGTGKTTFATNILYKASKKYRCGVFALEDRLNDYGIRAMFFEIGKVRRQILGDQTPNYPWNQYRKNIIHDEDYLTYRDKAFENLKNENIFFAKVECQMDIDLLEELVEQKSIEGYELFLIDHLHYFDLLKGDIKKADYIEKIMIRLRQLQIRTGARILLVVHYKKLEGRKPTLDSFKDSISIVQNANYVINIWRNRKEGGNQFKTLFAIPKARNPNGEGTIEVEFDPVENDYKPKGQWKFGTVANQEQWDAAPGEKTYNEDKVK